MYLAFCAFFVRLFLFSAGVFSLHNFGFGGLDTGRDKILKIGNNQFENLVYGVRFNSDPLHLNHSFGRQLPARSGPHLTYITGGPHTLSLSLLWWQNRSFRNILHCYLSPLITLQNVTRLLSDYYQSQA